MGKTLADGEALNFGKVPPVMLKILEEGGLIAYTRKHGDLTV